MPRWAWWLGAFLVAALLTVATWWGWVALVLVTWVLIVAA